MAGLCNRLRVMAACLRLAREQGEGLRVCWSLESEMNAFFSELFEGPWPFDLRESARRSLVNRLLFSRWNPAAYGWNQGRDFVQAARAARRARRLFLSNYYDICHNPDLSWLRPVAPIRSQIDAHLPLAQGAVGLHIRRTDNRLCIHNSPLHLFTQAIERELARDAKATFFLSTDDEATRKELAARYGTCIRSRLPQARRDDRGGVADGVVDLYLLASCTRIYGSYPSSFSDIAARIGSIPLAYLTVDNPIGPAIPDESPGPAKPTH